MRRSFVVAAGLAALLVPLALAQDFSVRDRPGASAPDDLATSFDGPGPFGIGPGDAPLAPGSPLRAKPRAHAPHPPRDAFPAIVRFLDLSEDQAAETRALLGRRHEAVRPLHEEISAREERLRQLVDAGAAPGVIGEQVLAIHELHLRAREIQGRFVAAFVDLLGPDQLERYHAVVRSARLQPAVRAFGALRLLPPAPAPGDAGI